MRSSALLLNLGVVGLLLSVVAWYALAATAGQKPKSGTQIRKPKTVPRSEYVSDSTCEHCHAGTFAAYQQTAHHFTSQIAGKDSIVGTFAPGSNTMTTANPNLTFRMEEKNAEFFQTAIWGAPDSATAPPADSAPEQSKAARTRTERLDLVIGSGGKG
jgi:cytochrome c5